MLRLLLAPRNRLYPPSEQSDAKPGGLVPAAHALVVLMSTRSGKAITCISPYTPL
jgi:hypothetical protein